MLDTENNSSYWADEHFAQKATNWALVPVSPLAALFINDLATWWVFALLGGGLGILAAVSNQFSSTMRDYVFSFCLVGQCILFTSALAGHAWQIDSHMMYFAVLAIISTLNSPKALIFGTALVAVHHLSVSMLMPHLVYPGGNVRESLERTVIHAVIVLLEAGILLISLSKRIAAEKALDTERQTSQLQTKMAQEAEHKANEGRTHADHVVGTLENRLARLAQGQLDCHIVEDFPQQYQQLRQSFNEAIQKLGQTIDEVYQTASRIGDSTSTLNQSSNDLSRRTETQAATLEETAAAMEQLSSSVKLAVDGAKNAEASSVAVRQEAEASGKIVQGAVSAMESIKMSSDQISKIINVIDDIAFQTNLLALNAGVEAARAGEAGRGFAVVASEVRALAHRSADAATEIKTLIEQSMQQVMSGVDMVGQAGTAIDAVVEKFNSITHVITQVADRSKDQSHGLSEINVGVGNLDKVTQRNAAMVNDLAAQGQQLGSDATRLSELMQSFQTGGNIAWGKKKAA